jgi:zinc protease
MLTTFTLENGLRVLIQEMHHAPVASFWLWYRVGSRNEIPGITGISHWVEHMFFKGTPAFPKGELDRLISSHGGSLNGFTWLDFTTFLETLPADHIDLALRVEADRMVNAAFAPDEVEAERTVIISERQGNENDPVFLLEEEVQAAAFRVHPYHHDTIGDMCDLETITAAQLAEHHRRYYGPHNAIAILVGDVQTAQARERISELFGGIARGPEPPKVTQKEPEQKGERRVIVEGEDQTPYLQVCYHAPAAQDPDFMKLRVLNAVLAGANSMSLLSGGGSDNRSSRLYKALVEKELATGVAGIVAPTTDPFLYSLSATVRSGRSLGKVEAALDAELARLVNEPVSDEELHKAIKQVRAQFAYSAESVSSQAYWLGLAEVVADRPWFENFLDRLAAVTPADVQELAGRLLRRGNRITGWYSPRKKARGKRSAK